MNLGLSGLASGFDWQSLIDQLIQVGRAPQSRLRTEQNTLAQQKSAYGTINSQLSTLLNRAKSLNTNDLFDSRQTATSDPTTASANASPGAAVGSYQFQFVQTASPAKLRGATNISQPLSLTNDVSSLTLSSAGFARSVTAGTFTVNGRQIQIQTSDSLQGVFDKIQTATGGAVTASYNAATDKIDLASAGEIVLGSATDTSNFLSAAQLYNNGSGAVSSSSALGGVKLNGPLASANLVANLSDGGSGAGEFKINGVSIAFNATTDSLKDVLDRINSSAAGVTATYDSVSDRLSLTNQSAGDIGVALEDVTGNFLVATGLTTGSLERGKNLLYTINGGEQLTSQTNTVTEASSGLRGLTVTALKEESVTVTVSNDTGKVKQAIKDFLTDYNKVQSLIETQTASSTDSAGKVTAGVLASDSLILEVASKLRSLAFAPDFGGTQGVRSLADLGIDSNGKDNSLTLTDETKLDAALANDLEGVKNLFTRAETGLAVKLNDYLQTTSADGGTLASRQDSFTKRSGEIDTQIATLERRLQDEQQRLTETFVAMETAQAKINQQLKFLQERFGSSN